MARKRAAPRADQQPSSLARLEAVVADPARARTDRTFNEIRFEAGELSDPSPWLAAALSLEMRELVAPETGVYLAEIFLEGITERAFESDPELVRLSDEMVRIERAHGLGEDETWMIGEAPPEHRALNDAWNRRDAAIRAAALRAMGNDALAELLENDPDEFERRSVEGHRQLWGSIDNGAN